MAILWPGDPESLIAPQRLAAQVAEDHRPVGEGAPVTGGPVFAKAAASASAASALVAAAVVAAPAPAAAEPEQISDADLAPIDDDDLEVLDKLWG